jgi:[acyl-carrier-protein] S-malonyltransferase
VDIKNEGRQERGADPVSKIGFLFAGQGAQYVGMGKELYEHFSCARQIFDRASEAVGFDLAALCHEGPIEDLNSTENTQPAVVTTSIAALAALQEQGVKADVVAGLSLGEYSALYCAGIFDLPTVVKLVQKRGKYMQEAIPQGVGTMAAILGLSAQGVEEACEEAKDIGIVETANYNCPGQIVIGGEVKAVQAACEIAVQKGAMKAVPLSVSAPFHTSMLAPAAEKLSAEIEHINLGSINIPIISNVTAQYIEYVDQIKPLLTQQVMKSVLWEQTIRQMMADGVDIFVEIGPGKVLSGFVKKIDRKAVVVNVEDLKSLEKAVSVVGGKSC